ncbi:MAG: thiamine pyrophosphate-dependent enzyme [Methanobacteriaceae archaeon]|nr:thiamine pyrophosphate-dependent enzyme [Methanobacteriaceae archaeon]MDP2835718.1 thiamine pyrophosphate-dependent enzyme [Methanobacteriaceae archaeon]MDP3033751.1 thiamine pyrophosphate-dependent enzyme [Methanobacteriaceae archaeon]MDP3484023.1 thiamine pyrophosphate-dependent enzyme [Methanobacteriaceae archaeon]MDP3624535.1 thiamine pyrophosphate-dependent enzyme [Methanobacteriaceae archaeon]
MDPKIYDMEHADVAWCPGCGNFPILKSLKMALGELEIPPEELVMVSGIGQAGKLPHYIKANVFNGLHGRSLSPATGIKASNNKMTVIAVSGDGCTYGEGGNHFMHTIRRNPNITNIVHNNMVYGLTKGQASPTSRAHYKTSFQVDGVFEEPFNPVSVAISLGATFVARAFAGDINQTKEIIKKAINHQGYALVDIFQPCVTFNKVNTFQWFKENSYYLEDSYVADDKVEAFKRAIEGPHDGEGKFPLGIFYVKEGVKTFEENISVYREDDSPLFTRKVDKNKLKGLIESKRSI